MQKRSLALMLACALGVVTTGVFAAGAADEMKIHDPYVRAVPPGQQNSASFMVIENGGTAAHALVAASSPAAQTVELHTHTMADGMMQMRRVEQIDLPAGEQVALQPGGYHVMLIGLTGELQLDAPVAITLEFEDGSKQEINAPVRRIEMQMKKPESGHMMH